ncbi:hypothetical protein Scep_000994 [Stephania cephalantha]|uniref:Retrotransposon Copia-like N-terminal domain-containing protein n=1 Tax=Stephania cephalantha TaxID=152367 RepID=A0AAP0Q3J2_9MAGN
MAETTSRAGKEVRSASPAEDRSTLSVDESPPHRARSKMEEVISTFHSHETIHHGTGFGPSVGKSSSQTQIIAPFGSSLNQMVPMKLDRTNFVFWKSMMLPLFRGCKLDGYNLGTVPRPPVTLAESGLPNPEYETWYEKDQVCLGWLISSLDKSVASCAMGVSSAYDVWHVIEEYCGSHYRAMSHYYKRQIQSCKKGSLPIFECLLKMKDLADNLAMDGSQMSSDELISNVLLGLESEYLPIVTLLQDKTDLRWSTLQASLLRFEATFSHMQGSRASIP